MDSLAIYAERYSLQNFEDTLYNRAGYFRLHNCLVCGSGDGDLGFCCWIVSHLPIVAVDSHVKYLRIARVALFAKSVPSIALVPLLVSRNRRFLLIIALEGNTLRSEMLIQLRSRQRHNLVSECGANSEPTHWRLEPVQYRHWRRGPFHSDGHSAH